MISLKIELVTCKIMLLFVLVLIASHRSYAQSVPARFAYQAVIRDSKGALIVDDEVGIKIEIAKESGTGTVIFSEDHKVLTNKQGLVSLEIGSKADLSTINWAQGPYFIVLSVDTEGGTDYTEVGSYQLLSVPYALYAANGGVPGPKGDPGISIKSGAVNTNGNLVLTLTDNTTKDVGNVKGTPGSQGAAGRGVASFVINSLGELVVTYSDNITANLGKVKGDNGNAGNYQGSSTIDISNNTVSVKDNSISSTKIIDGTISNSDIMGDAITSNKIANRTIQSVDIAQMNATANQVLSWSGTDWIPTTPSGGSGGNPTGAAGGDLSGTYPNPTIGNSKVIESKIADNAVTSNKIANGTISTADLADQSITTSKIADGTILGGDLNSMNANNGQVLTYENGWKPKNVSGGSELWEEVNLNIQPKNNQLGLKVKNVEFGQAFTNFPGQLSPQGIILFNNQGTQSLDISEFAGGGSINLNDGVNGNTINLDGNSYGTIQLFDKRGSDFNSTMLMSGGDPTSNTTNFGHPEIALFNHLNTTQKLVRIYVDASHKGILSSNGVKSFFMDHPTKADSMIWYACIEGPEAASYERGTASLNNGEAFITFSDHFAIVVNPKTMTVSTSPNSALSKGLAVIEKSEKGIKIKELNGGKGNYTFDWEVKGVRKGHEDFKVIRHKSEGQSTGDGESDNPVLPRKPK